jgi:DNA modification methylase
MEVNKIHTGRAEEVLKSFPDNCIDTVITDPPYGLSNHSEKLIRDVMGKWLSGQEDYVPDIKGFMSKSWDAFVPPPAVWREVYRVMKPGGTILVFAGSRTQDLMAMSLRLAGFEIKDTIMWLYGQGFPKSKDISKEIDKRGGKSVSWFGKWLKEFRIQNNIQQKEIAKLFPSKTGRLTGCVANWELGLNLPTPEQFNKICKHFNLPFKSLEEAKREIIGKQKTNLTVMQKIGQQNISGEIDITAPATPEAKQWEGYGTALKPSYESVLMARKPLEKHTDIEYIIDICQKLFAQIVKQSSILNQAEQKEGSNIAQWSVDKSINTLEDLLEVMDTLRSYTMENTSLSIVLSWLNILAEIWLVMNMSTIKTEINLTTELKILKSMEWENILANIIKNKSNQKNGLSVSVYNVESILNAVLLKLNYIREHSVDDPAISSEKLKDLRPSLSPIILAIKPNEGSYADNALRWNVSGLNIELGRLQTVGRKTGTKNPNAQKGSGNCYLGSDGKKQIEYDLQNKGRFPANVILDEEAAQMLDEQSGISKSGKVGFKNVGWRHSGNKKEQMTALSYQQEYNDKGGPSRFFYTAKASKSERGEFNHHPTVKSLSLVEYLVKLTSMPNENQIYLDPFIGSGTTAIACTKLGKKWIGIEVNPEYVEIAKRRIQKTAGQYHLF